MLKPGYRKTIAILVPIAFLCSGCFTYLSSFPEERLPDDDPPPVQPPPVIIIENHFYPLPPAPEPQPPKPKRPFDRHDPAPSKDESARPDTDRRISREENNGSGGSEADSSGRRRTRQ